jgi:hypothetical protein
VGFLSFSLLGLALAELLEWDSMIVMILQQHTVQLQFGFVKKQKARVVWIVGIAALHFGTCDRKFRT